jgi:magnesium-transporting ATPase (P-type)
MTVKSVIPLVSGVSDKDVLLTAALCSRAENADPIDKAMLQGFTDYPTLNGNGAMAESGQNQSVQIHIRSLLPSLKGDEYETLKFIPFDASTRRTEALVRYKGAGDGVSRVTKGAVATLAQLAGIPLDSPEYAHIDHLVGLNALKGYKTVGVGIGSVDPEEGNRDHDEDERQALLTDGHQDGHGHGVVPAAHGKGKFHLIGLISLHDPPRADSASIIKKLSDLGIRTKMLTGDSMGVAVEMGRQLHMGDNFINLELEKAAVKNQWAKEKEARLALTNDSERAAKEQHAVPSTTHADEVRLTIDAPKEESAAEHEARLMDHLLSRFDPMTLTGFAQIFPADKHAIVQNAQKKGYVCGMTGVSNHTQYCSVSVVEALFCVISHVFVH